MEGLDLPSGGLLPLAQHQIRAQSEFLRHPVQGVVADRGRTELDQVTLGMVRVVGEYEVGHRHLQDGVPQELQTFVGRPPPGLGYPGSVTQRLVEMLGIRERVFERAFQTIGSGAVGVGHERTSPCSRRSTRPPLTPSVASWMALRMANRDDEPWHMTTPADVPTRWAPP